MKAKNLINRKVTVYSTHEQVLDTKTYDGRVVKIIDSGVVVRQKNGKLSVPFFSLCKID